MSSGRSAKALVSVVVPTHGHADLICQTLESVFSQTFRNLEVIVIDDGSPDDTAEVLEPFVRAGVVEYVKQSNMGQAAARNRGLEMANGEFIAFLDDDDLWPQDKIEWQADYLRSHPAEVCIGGTHATLRDGELHLCQTKGRRLGPMAVLAGGVFTSPGQTLIRTHALRSVGGFDTTLWGVDDTDLWYRLSRLSPIRQIERVSLYYRVHAGNASRRWREMYDNHAKMLATRLAALDPADKADFAMALWDAFVRYQGPICIGKIKDAVRHRTNFGDAAFALRRLAALGGSDRLSASATAALAILFLPTRLDVRAIVDQVLSFPEPCA